MKKFVFLAIAASLSILALIPTTRSTSTVAHAGDPTTGTIGVDVEHSSQTKEASFTEQNQQRLLKTQPLPELQSSAERQNLISRLNLLNDVNKVGYVYLLGPQGQLVGYYTIKGKVTSLNSYLTANQEGICLLAGTGSSDRGCLTVDQPDLDGSYGKNPEGVFFFTTAGVYVEWSGSYLYSDHALSYTTKPILVENGQ